MNTKLKKCSRCLKDKVIWKNKIVEGEKKQFCKVCYGIIERDISKEKRKKIREKRKESVKFTDCKKLIQRLAKLCNEPICCTSGYVFKDDEIKTNSAHGGHWRAAGAHPSTALYLLNIHPQTYAENCHKHGNEYEYSLFLDRKYGVEVKEEIYRMSHIPYKWSKPELLEFKLKCIEHLNMLDQGVSREKVKSSFLEWQHSTEWYMYMKSKLVE